MDRVSKEKRSEIMSRVKSKNTSPERFVFAYLRKEKIHFQRHYRHAPGSPDIALPRKRKAVFIEGGFWHGWQFQKLRPKLAPYWRVKIANNMRRDKRNRVLLVKLGWSVLRIWDHDLKRRPIATLERITSFLRDQK
jgi:DNA mismatch endonuclease (patch repair protein)